MTSSASLRAASFASTMANASRCHASSSAVALALAAAYSWFDRSASRSARTSACSACSPCFSSSICRCSWIASRRSDSTISAIAALRASIAVTPRLKMAINSASDAVMFSVVTPSFCACSDAAFSAALLSFAALVSLSTDWTDLSYSLASRSTDDCALSYSKVAAFCSSRNSTRRVRPSVCLSINALNLV